MYNLIYRISVLCSLYLYKNNEKFKLYKLNISTINIYKIFIYINIYHFIVNYKIYIVY